jgi:HK97 gp10 family phage protein|tara:strand:+ start:10769 stop:11230 length:462 start_codon:yes stop_codon:yes gene_type:complete
MVDVHKAEVVQGFKALDKKLEALSDPRLQRKAIRQALNFAVTPVLQSARANIPKGTKAHKTYLGRIVAPGFASRSIKKKIKIEGTALVAKVGLKKEAFYALFYETGTSKGGPHSSDRPARPWLEPALEGNKTTVVKRFGEKMGTSIKKIAAKR